HVTGVQTCALPIYQERHARAAQPAIDRHAPPRRDGERDRLRVTVEQIHVTRPTGEGARRMNAVADVLHAARAVARDDESRRFVVEAKRGNAVVLAVKDAHLAVGGRRRKATEPPAQDVSLRTHHLGDRWTIAQLD